MNDETTIPDQVSAIVAAIPRGFPLSGPVVFGSDDATTAWGGRFSVVAGRLLIDLEPGSLPGCGEDMHSAVIRRLARMMPTTCGGAIGT